jgi:hypothetical protein
MAQDRTDRDYNIKAGLSSKLRRVIAMAAREKLDLEEETKKRLQEIFKDRVCCKCKKEAERLSIKKKKGDYYYCNACVPKGKEPKKKVEIKQVSLRWSSGNNIHETENSTND